MFNLGVFIPTRALGFEHIAISAIKIQNRKPLVTPSWRRGVISHAD